MPQQEACEGLQEPGALPCAGPGIACAHGGTPGTFGRLPNEARACPQQLSRRSRVACGWPAGLLLLTRPCNSANGQLHCLTAGQIQACTASPAALVAHASTKLGTHDRCARQVFLGDQSVGKTSIITRFMYDKFDNTYQVSHFRQAHTPLHTTRCCQLVSSGCRLLSVSTSCQRPCTLKTALSGSNFGENL